MKNLFVVFSALVILLSMYFVLAALTDVTLVTPAESGIVNGTYTFNATITGVADNVTFYHNQSGSWEQFCINASGAGLEFTCVNDTNTIDFPDGTYYFNATAKNDTTTVSVVNADVIVDNNNPSLDYTTGTPTNNAGENRTWIFVNVTASDTNNDSLVFLLYNSTTEVNRTVYTDYTKLYINWTDLPEETYTYNVTANDSATRSNSTSTRTFYLDGTNPTVSHSCSPTSVIARGTITCSCSGADNLGVDTTSYTANPSTSSTGTFSTGCTVTDYAGNSISSSVSYTVTSSGGGSPSTPANEWAKQRIHLWPKMTPGVVNIMKDFDKETGIKEIQIQVNNPAQNVKITVSKYDSKPANVSIEKSGKVYQYMQIKTKNLENKLEKAVITIKVEKTWVSDNALNKNQVSLFKFNENSKKWDELSTVYNSSDNTYDYFDVELTSFSYFAIGEKTTIVEENGEATSANGEASADGETKDSSGLRTLIIIVIIILILAGAGYKKFGKPNYS